MKRTIKVIVVILVTGIATIRVTPCAAQSDELQQLILNIEKLTQLKSILSDMKTGYQIYEQGYGTISGLSKGNFDLHHVYLTGLLAVSLNVRGYGRIAAIISMQGNLVSEYRNRYALFKRSGSFNPAEIAYMGKVYSGLLTESIANLEELSNVITAGKLRMSDAERIRAIDRIYGSSSDKLQFLRSFNRQGTALSIQRSRDAADSRTLKQLYGLTN